MERSLKVAIGGIVLLIVALLLALKAMSSVGVAKQRSLYIDLLPGYVRKIELRLYAGYSSTSVNASITSLCPRLTAKLVDEYDKHRKVIEVRSLGLNKTMRLFKIDRFINPVLYLNTSYACRAIVRLSFIEHVAPYAYLSIPAFFIMIMGTVMLFYGGVTYIAGKIARVRRRRR